MLQFSSLRTMRWKMSVTAALYLIFVAAFSEGFFFTGSARKQYVFSFCYFYLFFLFIRCFLPFLAPSIRHPCFVFNDPTVIYLFTKLITINPLHYFVRVFSIIYRICYFIISFSRLRLFTLIYSCL